MKKPLVCLVVLIMAASLFGASVTVTSPAAGATWVKGQGYAIAWTKTGDMPNTVRISLRDKTGATEVKLIADNQPNSGSYSWTVPQDVPDGEYVIRVKVKNAAVSDDSGVFSIASSAPPAASITVTKPASGDSWNRSASHLITWTKTGSMPNLVKISLMDQNSVAVVREIADNQPNSGSYSWTIPADIAFGSYRVRVAVKTTTIKDDSATFKIGMMAMKPPAKKAETLLQAQQTPLHMLYDEYEKSGMYKNWSNPRPRNDSNPPPPSCWQGLPTGYPQGAGVNQYALVGYDYLYCQSAQYNGWLTFCYRSQVIFPVGEFQGRAAKLVSAKMRLRQVSCLKSGDNSASCGVGMSVFKAPWTDWSNTPVQDPRGLLFNDTDYTLDITDIVKKWLDGSLANNGLLLISREVYWGQAAQKCFSSFEVTLKLRFSRD
jgi:hypothetical protein